MNLFKLCHDKDVMAAAWHGGHAVDQPPASVDKFEIKTNRPLRPNGRLPDVPQGM